MTLENDILTVSSVTRLLKGMMEKNFSNVKIRGELSAINKAGSGHIYTSLKDETSVIKAVVWNSTQLPFKLEEGMEIIATGKISVYATRGEYQLIITQVEMAGVGAILKMLEERKQKLAKEGLFDEEHKQKLPKIPQTIGVITSPTGAVFHDIQNRLRERFPVHVLLYPATVQGVTASSDVIKGIEYFNKEKNVEVIIVARGGGSLEDLLPFSDEELVRAVYNSKIPIISGIGHDPDWMLIDFVSDKRASTPTMAAEIVVPTKLNLSQDIENFFSKINIMVSKSIVSLKDKIKNISIKSPKQLIMENYQKIDNLINNINLLMNTKINILKQKLNSIIDLNKLIQQKLDIKKQNFSFVSNMLNSLSYKNTLKRGFVIVKTNNKIISKKEDFQKPASLEFSDGTIDI